MDMQGALGAMQSRPLPTVSANGDVSAIKKTAQQFESVFISEFLGSMFEGVSTDGPFGGGQGEEMFRSLEMDEYGKQLAAQGGFGLADAVTRQLLHTQEHAQ
jgi:Rod binding domain-containing protein